MRVLSLCDGIACGRLALERAGIPVERYVAYEIDPWAIRVARWNYPDIEHRGDITRADFSEFEGFDIVIGGFPCTDLSCSGHREGLGGKCSRLFWKCAEAIRVVNPRYFLIENNVGMPAEAKRAITLTLGVEPVEINSALVSAQNRKRYYWTNIPGIEQPKDRGLSLGEILSEGIATRNPKSHALTASYYKAIIWNSLERKQRTMVAVPLFRRGRGYVKDKACSHVKAPTLTRSSYENNVFPVVPSHSGGGYEVENGILFYRDKRVPCNLPDSFYTFRKFTPEECERLQTLPDGYTEIAPKTQRYIQCGNGWTIEVIAHILRYAVIADLL